MYVKINKFYLEMNKKFTVKFEIYLFKKFYNFYSEIIFTKSEIK